MTGVQTCALPIFLKWNNNVKLNNIDAIEKTLGIEIPLEENETSLDMTEKRSKLYEKDDIEAGIVEDTYKGK